MLYSVSTEGSHSNANVLARKGVHNQSYYFRNLNSLIY